jgi:hypothetical protein
MKGVKGLRPFPKNMPAVFMFQPTHYKMMTSPKELREWERLMIEYVGMDPKHFGSRQRKGTAKMRQSDTKRPPKGPGGSISGSGRGWDDCDE